MIMDNDNTVSEAVTVAIRHIGLGTSSSGKIYAYLQQKGYGPSVCNEAVSELIEREYIDDLKAGRAIIRKRTGKKQESRSLMTRRLLAGGVSREKVDILVSELEDDRDTCVSLFDALYPIIPNGDVNKLVNEFITVASRRGYSVETATSAFRIWLAKH